MGKKKGKVKKGEYEWSAELSRIVPLQNDFCYIRDDKGKTHHVKRNSEQFNELVSHLDEVMNGKVSRELQELGWDQR